MNNLRETYVTYETAILAREKGFDWDCKRFYGHKTHKLGYSRYGAVRNVRKAISAPTQEVLRKWLREKHFLNTFVSFKLNIKKWDYIVYDMSMDGKEYLKYYREYYLLIMKRKFDTFEDSLEQALTEGLKQIKNG